MINEFVFGTPTCLIRLVLDWGVDCYSGEFGSGFISVDIVNSGDIKMQQPFFNDHGVKIW